MKNKNYRLDFVITRACSLDGAEHDLPIDEFITIPGRVTYSSRDEAECVRVDLSREATNGYYRVVEF